MLTIQNIDKIVNHAITNEWQIRSMHEVTQSDYVNGVKLYEAIVESQILDITQKQIGIFFSFSLFKN
jgi:hypothetical protein